MKQFKGKNGQTKGVIGFKQVKWYYPSDYACKNHEVCFMVWLKYEQICVVLFGSGCCGCIACIPNIFYFYSHPCVSYIHRTPFMGSLAKKMVTQYDAKISFTQQTLVAAVVLIDNPGIFILKIVHVPEQWELNACWKKYKLF